MGRKDDGLAIARHQLYGIWPVVSREAVLPLGAGFAQAVDQVGDGQQRVGQEHARPGISHHFLDFSPLPRGVTVARAVAAGGFVLLERAMSQTSVGIGQECLAIIAKAVPALVTIAAEAADHEGHGPGLPLHARG